MPNSGYYAKFVVCLISVAAMLFAACSQTDEGAVAVPSPTGTVQPERTATAVPTSTALPTATAVVMPRPTLVVTPTSTPTLVAPQWLPTALPRETPTPEPPPRPEPTLQPGATPQSEQTLPVEQAVPRFMHQARLLEDGRVLMSGGFTGIANNNFIVPIPLHNFEIYDPETGLWLLIMPDVNQAFMTSTLKISIDRYMSVGLGTKEGGLTGVAGVFDAAAQSWTALPPPSYVRGIPDMALLKDGRVLVTGGVDFSNPTGFSFDSLAETEVFDPRTEVWQQTAPMSAAAENQAVVSLEEGRVLVVQEGNRSAEIYDPETDSWTLTAAMNSTPLNPEAVALPDGRVLVTGVLPDEIAEDDNFTRTYYHDTDTWVLVDSETGEEIEVPQIVSEIYDPANDAWTATKAMTALRLSHTLTLLPDGRALVTGGISMRVSVSEPTENAKISDLMHPTTEIFDPRTDEWIAGPEMAEPRYDHTATLLPDGRIFLHGGVTVRMDIQEIYPTYTSEFIILPAPDE